MLVMTLLLASIETVKLEDSEDDIEDVRKGREIMEKVKANNLSFQFDLVINRYVRIHFGSLAMRMIHYISTLDIDITVDFYLRLIQSQTMLPNFNFTGKTFSEEAYFRMIYDMNKSVERIKYEENRR